MSKALGKLAALSNGAASPVTAPQGLREHDLDLAHAVMVSMANGLTATQAAAQHGVKESWADNLVNRPPAAVRDADWFGPLLRQIKARRAQRKGIKVVTERRRV